MAEIVNFAVTLKRNVTASAGTGLFTKQPVNAGSLVFNIDRPLITVLDSARLRDHCEWCLDSAGEEDGEDEGRKLRVCTGCKIVRYCSKVGQTCLLSMMCYILRHYSPQSRNCLFPSFI